TGFGWQRVPGLAPKPAGLFAHLQTGEQRDQFFAAQGGAGALRTRPGEAAFLQALGAHPQAAAVPEQQLEPVAMAISEDKPMAGAKWGRAFAPPHAAK